MKKHFFISCMLITIFANAKKWDASYISKLVAKGEIDKVIEFYKTRYDSDKRDPQDAFRIAELYVKKKEYATALSWYDKESQLVYSSKINLFNYATTNRLMGEYQKALDAYLMYAALTGDVNKVMDLANQCERVIRSSALAYNYKLENYTYNTADNEAYIAVLRTNPVYITTKNNITPEDRTTNEIQQIVRAYENFAPPVKAYMNNVPNMTITGLSYTQDGNNVVFSAIDEKSASKKHKSKLEKIYIADNLGGNFLNVKLLPIDVDGYSLKNPSFNKNGTTIYFSSNMPGGFGGYDIWQTTLKNNAWSTPKNLGKLVNSSADEINPFMPQDGADNILYYSSNREGGFGGFDIYSVIKTAAIWEGAVLQPAPINSAGDDNSIIYDNETKTGYFTSNRSGGKGNFDVYRYTPFNLQLIVAAKDTFSEKPIDYALVQVIDAGDKLFEGVTNENGISAFQINKNKNYTLKVSKDAYRPALIKVNSFGKANGDSIFIDVPLKPDSQFSSTKGASNTISLDNYIVFTGKVISAATNKPAKNTKMRMVNYTTQKLREVDIDSTGRFEIKLLLNNNYKVIFESPDNKVTDELTTLGTARNSIKVRDYLLSGSKLKLLENKVYTIATLPSDIKLSNVLTQEQKIEVANTTIIHEPIRQEKIDSLIRVIAEQNPINTNKGASAKLVQQETSSTPKKNILEEKKGTKIEASSEVNKGTDVLHVENINSDKQDKVSSQNIIITKTITVDTIAKISQPLTVENESIALAADMVDNEKSKKIKVLHQKNNDTEIEKVVPDEIKIEQTSSTITSINPTMVETKPQAKLQTPVAAQTNTNDLPKNDNTMVAEMPNIPAAKTDILIAKPEQAAPIAENYYKVQLASYDEGNIQFPEFAHLGKVEEVIAYNRFIYRLGDFDNLEKAKEVLTYVREQGYFVAFILQYNKNKITGIVK